MSKERITTHKQADEQSMDYKHLLISRCMIPLLFLGWPFMLLAQKRVPVIQATSNHSIIEDGEIVKIDWKLDPTVKPDIYYLNIPHRKNKVKLRTDKDEISFKTNYGESYDVVVLLNGTDSCLVRFMAKEDPTTVSLQTDNALPLSIPFTLIGSRIYFQGQLNGQKEVAIQFDLGAGGCCVNKLSADKLQLAFGGKTMLSNTQGFNEARNSLGNEVVIGGIKWSGVTLTEVGNMKPHEDLIIGNGLFRDKIIEIDYDQRFLIIHDRLPAVVKDYQKQPVFYEQNRPRFKVSFVQNGLRYSFWFLFDTGRDGTMLIGEDFTSQGKNWENLKELQVINGRKIVRLDAMIAGREIKDIVTNAADPSKPAGRPTLFGNQVLNQFNVILDNRQGFLYLKPNNRVNERYSDYKSYVEEMSKTGK